VLIKCVNQELLKYNINIIKFVEESFPAITVLQRVWQTVDSILICIW